MTKFKKIASVASVAALTGLPLLGLASNHESVKPTSITGLQDIYTIVQNAAGWVQAFFFTIAAIFIILAAFNYLTAGGDDEKLKAAKQKLIYAIVAIIIGALAFVFQGIVKNFIEQKGGGVPKL